jgi:hypothetical protein
MHMMTKANASTGMMSKGFTMAVSNQEDGCSHHRTRTPGAKFIPSRAVSA